MDGLGHFDFWGARFHGGTLWPHGAVGPDMEFFDIAQNTRVNQFNGFAQAAFGCALIAHLGAEFFLFGQFAKNAGFFHGVGERLLNINMLAHAHCHGSGRGVGVVGSGNDDGVDAFV